MEDKLKSQITNDDIEKFILDYMSNPKLNSMKEIDGYAFDTPLIGFSSASDSYYSYYKNHISSNFYLLPQEWLKCVYHRNFDPANVSIISWALPQTSENRSLSRQKSDCPALQWQMVRVYGEECNCAMAKALQDWFNEKGIEAVAPIIAKDFSWYDSEQFYLISNWSERHTAFISGLGTFGLCDGLITKKGKAARFGSIIINLSLKTTARTYTKWDEYCQAKNGCKACINRCPANAISKEYGHNKALCQKYHKNVIKPIAKSRYNYSGLAVCGLCQTGVPCECSIPEPLK